MTVDVTAKDIRRGKPRRMMECPVSLALGRLTGDDWIVTSNNAMCMNEKRTCQLRLPAAVRDWIANYDDAVAVEPFSFELDVPQDAPTS